MTARLVRVTDGKQLWSSQFDEKFTDIFAVQDAICERVARELALNLRGEKRERLTKHYTASADAYQLYLKGRYYWYKSTPQDALKARECFQQAIDLDPSFALAYSGLADYYGRASAIGQMRPDEGWPKHEAAVRKALELDPDFAEIHNSLAGLKLYYYRDLPGAENEFKRALELDPNYVEARAHYGGYLTYMGRFDEAIAQKKRVQSLTHSLPASVAALGSHFTTRAVMTRRSNNTSGLSSWTRIMPRRTKISATPMSKRRCTTKPSPHGTGR